MRDKRPVIQARGRELFMARHFAQLTSAAQRANLRAIINPDRRAAYFRTVVDPTVVDLGTAENLLLFPWLQTNAFTNLPAMNLVTARYPNNPSPPATPYNGGVWPTPTSQNTVLEGISAFLTDQFGVDVPVANLFGSSGVISALEVIALALFSPGDQLLVPAPAFYGFPWSFSQKTVGMQFTTFQMDPGFDLTVANVQQALEQNPNAKLLVMTNPNNPTGINYPQSLLEEIYSFWLSDSSRHIISDEIYALSQVSGAQNPFVSALALDAYQQYGNQIHVTWGLSKDFGLAGFRAGFLVSQNSAVQQALNGGQCGPIPSWYASEAWFAPFGTLQPYVLQKLFFDADGNPDPSLAFEAMNEYHQVLQAQYTLTAGLLQGGNISYYPQNQGAIFFWIDLSQYLDSVTVTPDDENQLCADIYPYDDPREEALLNYLSANGVILVRGQECFYENPGWFRLCYTAATADEVNTGINNMIAALQALGT
jgi:aspartate/methionine/tyrosine aminotransferase